MKPLLQKEFQLAASPLSYLFIAGALLTFVPGYPILMGAFFTAMGIFYSFQTCRENNDIAYAMLLPLSKRSIVAGKFLFSLVIEGCSFLVMIVGTLLRMTVFSGAAVYTQNKLAAANLTFLGFSLLLFGLFNFVYIRGFFKTAYYFGKPFIIYVAVALLVIFIGEALWHIPALAALNVLDFSDLSLQLPALAAGVVGFVILTWLGFRFSVGRFEKIDL